MATSALVAEGPGKAQALRDAKTKLCDAATTVLDLLGSFPQLKEDPVARALLTGIARDSGAVSTAVKQREKNARVDRGIFTGTQGQAPAESKTVKSSAVPSKKDGAKEGNKQSVSPTRGFFRTSAGLSPPMVARNTAVRTATAQEPEDLSLPKGRSWAKLSPIDKVWVVGKGADAVAVARAILDKVEVTETTLRQLRCFPSGWLAAHLNLEEDETYKYAVSTFSIRPRAAAQAATASEAKENDGSS